MSKNIKSSTFKKTLKSSHFKSDNQRQISLDLSHTCRIRKRLISLIKFATFFEIIRLARCEYNKLDVCTISLHLQSFNKKSREDVFLFEERCVYIRRRMCLYSKKCVRITIFINISFRAKSKSNKYQYSRRLNSHRKCTFKVFLHIMW